VRAELVFPKKNLRQHIGEMNEDEKKKFRDEIVKSYCHKARAAREDETTSLQCKAWSKLNGGRYTEIEGFFYTGCTHPITTKTVVE